MNGVAIDFDMFTREQAEALNLAFEKIRRTTREEIKHEVKDEVKGEVVTNDALKVVAAELRTEMAALESRLSQKLIMWMVGLQFATFIGLLTLLPRFLT